MTTHTTTRFTSEEVARLRHYLGLTQERFAELLGVHVNTVRDWEQGRREPSQAWCRVLELMIPDWNRAFDL